MSFALTRQYVERTVIYKTSLDASKFNNRKRDSEAYQSFVSDVVYFSFELDGIYNGFAVLDDVLRGFSVSNRPLCPTR